MKVRALNHLRQTVGSLSVERVVNTIFEIDDETGLAAVEAGLVVAVEDEVAKPKRSYYTPKNRETK
jgi:hypothetical protein